MEEYIDRFEYELAQKFCQRALEMEPDNVRALETSGSLLIDLGNLDAAKQVNSLFFFFFLKKTGESYYIVAPVIYST